MTAQVGMPTETIFKSPPQAGGLANLLQVARLSAGLEGSIFQKFFMVFPPGVSVGFKFVFRKIKVWKSIRA